MAPKAVDGWNHNVHYHDRLLAAVPRPCSRALDVGCGVGAFARQLASRADHVDAIDLVPEVIEQARGRSAASNIRFSTADFLSWTAAPYDFISMIAVLHHMPFDEGVARAVSLLRPGGALAILGLDRATSIVHEAARSAVGYPVSGYYRLRRRTSRVNAPIREPEMTLAEIHRRAVRLLPGSTICRHLLWRYSLVWVKP